MSENGKSDLAISEDLLEILRCPQAVQESEKYGEEAGKLELVHNCWLVSPDTDLKYPIRDGIPIMLIDEGLKWKDTAVDDLPVPPPNPQPVGMSENGSNAPMNVSNDNGSLPIPAIIGGFVAILFVIMLLRRKKD